MLDLKFVRKNPDLVKEACQKKGFKNLVPLVDELLELDKKKREKITQIQKIRAKKNEISKKFKKLTEKEKKQVISQVKKLDTEEEAYRKELKPIAERIKDILFLLPNPPLPTVPVGKDDTENVILREVGKRPKFDFEPKDHLYLGEKLGIIDVQRAAKISGSRFGFLKREAALLEFAIINYAIENLIKEGFIPIIPPVLLKEEKARGTGYFEATDRQEAYFIPDDNLFLVGTSEQSLIAMHADEILDEKKLPKRYVGFSTCFRREAGSWGKDTRGIFRVHQFDKVEMISFCKPEDSQKEHRFFLEMEEKLMQGLKIPYRVVQICTGDLGRPAAEKFDIEAWLPGQGKYRETHSTSNCTDYQARRLNIRYRKKDGKLEFVHTINGTAFAIGRTIIAILENYQQKDGSVLIPEVLRKYLPFSQIKR